MSKDNSYLKEQPVKEHEYTSIFGFSKSEKTYDNLVNGIVTRLVFILD